MCDSEIVDLDWCHEHEAFYCQCCGKKEKAGYIERIIENVQEEEL